MTPQDLRDAAEEIGRRWPDALIYPNASCPGRNPHVPDNALAVDVDRLWPDGYKYGEYRLVAWIDVLGAVHYQDAAKAAWVDNQ